MKKLLIVLASVFCLLALSSCDDSMKVPDKLSCPAWMEGEWYAEGSEYAMIKVENGDILAPVIVYPDGFDKPGVFDGYESVFDTYIKPYNELGIITEFSEKSTSSKYTLKFVIDGTVEGDPLYMSLQYEITKKSDTQIEVKTASSDSKGAELVEIPAVTLTKK